MEMKTHIESKWEEISHSLSMERKHDYEEKTCRHENERKRKSSTFVTWQDNVTFSTPRTLRIKVSKRRKLITWCDVSLWYLFLLLKGTEWIDGVEGREKWRNERGREENMKSNNFQTKFSFLLLITFSDSNNTSLFLFSVSIFFFLWVSLSLSFMFSIIE